jgi:hypothetical protein
MFSAKRHCPLDYKLYVEGGDDMLLPSYQTTRPHLLEDRNINMLNLRCSELYLLKSTVLWDVTLSNVSEALTASIFRIEE